MIKILFIGDIVGEPGRKCVKHVFDNLLDISNYDLIVANGENLAGGKGITKDVFEEIISYGIDVVTLGNHSFSRKEAELIINHPQIVRPLNYPEGNPGQGYSYIKTKTGYEICVINILGRVFTIECLDCPFRTVNSILEEIKKRTGIIIVDFHAEVTSEKNAMGYFLDGKVSAVVGTHTHVPTNDAKILPNGTGYITDVGMCGPEVSIIGLDIGSVLKRFLLGVPQKFNVAKGSCQFNSVEIYIDEKTAKCCSIKPIIFNNLTV